MADHLKTFMTNRVCIIPIGDPAPAQDIATILSANGELEIKNKYFEATLSFDFDDGGKPPAVLWVSNASHIDKNIPKNDQYQDAELRLLLRIIDENADEEIPEKLKDWEVDNFAEIINVNMKTFEDEVRQFKEGNKRSSLLDEQLQPAGCRVLESLEMVNWPIKVTAGKSLIAQKIEKLEQMMNNNDPNLDSFDHAMSLLMELKNEIPKLPLEEKHKYAAEVAIIFQKLLSAGEEDENENENDDDEQPSNHPSPEGYATLPSEDEDEK